MITSHALQRGGTTAVLILGLKPFDRQAILKMKSKDRMRTMIPSKFLTFDDCLRNHRVGKPRLIFRLGLARQKKDYADTNQTDRASEE